MNMLQITKLSLNRFSSFIYFIAIVSSFACLLLQWYGIVLVSHLVMFITYIVFSHPVISLKLKPVIFLLVNSTSCVSHSI